MKATKMSMALVMVMAASLLVGCGVGDMGQFGTFEQAQVSIAKNEIYEPAFNSSEVEHHIKVVDEIDLEADCTKHGDATFILSNGPGTKVVAKFTVAGTLGGRVGKQSRTFRVETYVKNSIANLASVALVTQAFACGGKTIVKTWSINRTP